MRSMYDNVLELLCEHNFYAKKSKCTFFIDCVECLGFIISEDAIST